MTWQHSSLHLAGLSVATALGLLITPRLPIQAQNMPLPAQQVAIEWVPQDRGAPDESAGASSLWRKTSSIPIIGHLTCWWKIGCDYSILDFSHASSQ